MKATLLQIGSFYIRLEVPLVVTELLLGAETLEGMYTLCEDESFINCLMYKFTELKLGFIILNISFGIEKEMNIKNLE
jgi:hypothetical protein